ncbi:MAG: hypothetical protein WBN89_06385, partial [Prochlorococcaceae cyanobacterium]
MRRSGLPSIPTLARRSVPARLATATALATALGSALAGATALLLSAALPARAAGPTPQQLQALEAAFNGQGDLSALLAEGPGLDPAALRARRQRLLSQFPDARWQLTAGPALR